MADSIRIRTEELLSRTASILFNVVIISVDASIYLWSQTLYIACAGIFAVSVTVRSLTMIWMAGSLLEEEPQRKRVIGYAFFNLVMGWLMAFGWYLGLAWLYKHWPPISNILASIVAVIICYKSTFPLLPGSRQEWKALANHER